MTIKIGDVDLTGDATVIKRVRTNGELELGITVHADAQTPDYMSSLEEQHKYSHLTERKEFPFGGVEYQDLSSGDSNTMLIEIDEMPNPINASGVVSDFSYSQTDYNIRECEFVIGFEFD